MRRQWYGHLALTAVLAAAGWALDWRCGVLALIGGGAYGVVHLLPLRRRYRDIAALCEEIDRVLHGQERRVIGGSAEGELAILQNEIQKVTIRLRDAASEQQRQRLRLADAMADISHQLRTPLTSMNLTLSLRYLNENRGFRLTFDGFEAEIEEIFRLLLQNGCGIELNTNRGNTPLPDGKWLRMYREMGGEIITLGTDAHSAEYVGCAVRESQELLKTCGFKRFCTFEKMKPVWHEL